MSGCFLSIVIPVYQGSKTFSKLVDLISENVEFLDGKKFEIIAIEDGCPENSWEAIRAKAKSVNFVTGIKLSRNFGQHSAIRAGLENSSGDYVVVMDCDLQDNPIYIKKLVEEIQKGYEIIYTVKKKREHGKMKNLLTKMFNKILAYLADSKDDLQTSGLVGNFSIMSRKVCNEFLKLGDYKIHYLMVLRWLGFSFSYINIEHQQRDEGSSSYNFARLIEHAINGITFSSEKVLRFNIFIGLFIAVISLLGGFGIVIKHLLYSHVPGWTSIIFISLFSLGIILFSIGILGVYIGQIFSQVKNRQKYIVDEKISSNHD